MNSFGNRLRRSSGWLLAVGLGHATFASAPAAAQSRVDHSAYDQLLERYVDQRGLVDYRGWKARDSAALKRYLEALSRVDPERLADRKEKLAYWINLYNALTIDAMLHFYPLQSIKDKVSHLFGYNVWDDYKIAVGGRELSLNQIEHQILRKMDEPRIHFALVCAAMSCPRLLNEAYTGAELERQLERNSRHFFGAPDHLRVDRASKSVWLSPILDWYGEDFGPDDASLLEWVAGYAPEAARDFLRQNGDLEIRYLDYDWNLNQQP
ncbi:MAG TPA: DUF547 domain-containing protein [Acidobacteriota bacterium]